MKPLIITTLALIVGVSVAKGQSGAILIPTETTYSTGIIGSNVYIGSPGNGKKINIDDAGWLSISGKWHIQDTIKLLNAMSKDIILRDSLYYRVELERESVYEERQRAQTLFNAIATNNPALVKKALHKYYEWLRLHR